MREIRECCLKNKKDKRHGCLHCSLALLNHGAYHSVCLTGSDESQPGSVS